MRRRMMQVAMAVLVGALAAGCPPPEEPVVEEPKPPKPTKAQEIEATEHPRPLSNAFGVAEIVVGEDCTRKRYSSNSFAWRGNPHVWIIRNRCAQPVTVRVHGFSRQGGGGGAESDEAEQLQLFDEAVLERFVDGKSARLLRANVRSVAELGRYSYRITVDGTETESPWIVISDPR